MPAPVGVQRRLDIAAAADPGEHLAQRFLPPLLLRRPRLVMIVSFFQTAQMFFHDRVVVLQIKLSRVQRLPSSRS